MSKKSTEVQLDQQVQATKALSSVHALLSMGLFQNKQQEAVKHAIQFIEELYKQSLDSCLNHKDSGSHPDLIEYRKSRDEEKARKEEVAAEETI